MAALVYSVVLADGSVAVGGTEETPELREQIPNPLAWGEVPELSDEDREEPPRAGRGSGLDAWKAYAEKIGIKVDDDASRDDVIAQVDALRARA